jgi:hypothetical protein
LILLLTFSSCFDLLREHSSENHKLFLDHIVLVTDERFDSRHKAVPVIVMV